ncbi:MAG: S4 domain-containing protein [Actinomycetota bacterium]
MRAVVPPDLDGERLDRIVARLGGVSRAVARRMVEEVAATVDGSPAGVSTKVPAGS